MGDHARSARQLQGDKLSKPRRPRLDFQDHLADLEAAGLLVRIDRPINKDTELHPLVRCSSWGGVPEDKRRAFLFSNVTDGKGRRYDIPVVVGALAASPDIYRHRHGAAGRPDRGSLDAGDRQSDRAGRGERPRAARRLCSPATT